MRVLFGIQVSQQNSEINSNQKSNQIRFISGNIWPIKTTKNTTKNYKKRQTDRH